MTTIHPITSAIELERFTWGGEEDCEFEVELPVGDSYKFRQCAGCGVPLFRRGKIKAAPILRRHHDAGLIMEYIGCIGDRPRCEACWPEDRRRADV